MKCTIAGCPGEYEEGEVLHTVRHRAKVIVIDRVPAEVCTICGDVLFKPETVHGIEELLRKLPRPLETVPLYEYVKVSE